MQNEMEAHSLENFMIEWIPEISVDKNKFHIKTSWDLNQINVIRVCVFES